MLDPSLGLHCENGMATAEGFPSGKADVRNHGPTKTRTGVVPVLFETSPHFFGHVQTVNTAKPASSQGEALACTRK